MTASPTRVAGPMNALRRPFSVLLLLVILALFSSGRMLQAADAPARGEMVVFWSVDCPHCAEQKPFLRELERRHPDLTIRELEVSRSAEHHPLFLDMAASHGIDASSVPTTFFGGRAWVGDSPQIRDEIAATVARELPGLASGTPGDEGVPERAALPWLGDPEARSIVAITALIAFVDGVNPCSLWVLTLLLGLVIHSGSRGRVALVGTTFLVTTALIYGAFVAGVFGVLSYVLYVTWVRWLVAAFALVFGVVNIKDYFWFGRGLSFTIAPSHKPGIYRGIRRLTDRGLPAPALVGATVVMAAGIALVELPCTAGFPVVWSGILAERGITGGAFALLLVLYLAIYLFDELLVFGLAVFTLRMGRFEERHGRVLKLVGGAIMVALGLVLLVAPELMNDLGGSLAVFAGAAVLAAAAAALQRRREHA